MRVASAANFLRNPGSSLLSERTASLAPTIWILGLTGIFVLFLDYRINRVQVFNVKVYPNGPPACA
jgi:hypothetical protein